MQVNNSEINGFQIDQFNQYDLKVGAAESVCPTCSHTRKPENRKKKCASLDWEIGRHTSELQSHHDLVCRLLLENKKQKKNKKRQ